MHELFTATAVRDAPETAQAAAPAPEPIIVVGAARMDRPPRGGTLCWYCAHAFEGRAYPMPIKYDDKRDLFYVTGAFCGFPCMKRFNSERDSYLKHTNATTISLFVKRCLGRVTPVRSAPPRCALAAFGGTMSIAQFRGATENWQIVPPKMVSVDTVVAEQRSCRVKPKAANLATAVDFKDVQVKNETLKLRRHKPLQKDRNALERTMGINQLLQL